MSKVNDVFVSYRRSDGSETAKALFDYLDRNKLRVFYDTSEATTAELDGESFPDVLRNGVRSASAFVLIATPDAFAFRGKEDWVLEEIKTAMEMCRQSEDYKIIVLMTDGTVVPADLPKTLDGFDKFNQIAPGEEQFKRVLEAVTKINRRNLWNAGQRWLENSKKNGGRFANLDIDRTIMPKAKKRGRKEKFEQMPILVSEQQKDDEGHVTQGEEQPLLSALGSTDGDLYLIGQGGIGKTTALISIMNDAYEKKAYSETAQIPLFVELSRAPDTYGKLYAGGESTFIRRAIYQQVRGYKSIKEVPQSGVDAVDELLTKETEQPEYILLLDGLNEASRVQLEEANGYAVITMIMREIEWIIGSCPNARVILTSRTDETEIKDKSITRLHLSGVEDETIRTYLTARKLPKKRIDAAFADKKLLETIRIPLFLTMYTTLKNADEVSTQGEIFRVFFSERRDNLGTYTVQSRAEEVDEDVRKAASASAKARIDTKMQYFILDFILPEIAFSMEREGIFYSDITKIVEIITPILTDVSETAVCGRYGKDLFSKYRESTRVHTASVAKNMLKKLGDNITEVAENIIDCAVYSLAIMQEGQDGYGFMHHHIRDYFAAVRNVNSLRLAEYINRRGKADTARECLAHLREHPVGTEVRRFIGEYLHEHRNKPVYAGNEKFTYGVPTEPCDRNLIKRVLDLYRDRFGGEDGYSVYSLVNTITDVRGDLSGENLSRLDLSRITLNGTVLGRQNCGADLSGVKLGYGNVFPVGHTDTINSVQYRPEDGKHFISASWDNTVKVWDAESFALVATLEGHSSVVESAAYSPDGKRIVSASDDKTVKVWDAESFALVATLEGHSTSVSSAAYSPDGKRIVSASWDKTVKVWDAESFALVATLEGHSNWVNGAAYSPDGKRIVSASVDNTVKVWDAESFALVATLEGHSGSVTSAAYSPDGKRIVSASWDGTVKVWDAESFALVAALAGHSDSVSSAAYSPDGKRIVSASVDKTVKVWDAESFALVATLEGHSNRVTSAAYSPDGKRIVSASVDKTVKVWDAESFALVAALEGHSRNVNGAAYSPDGKRIVSASRDKTVKVWDAESFALVAALEGHSSDVTSAAYSTDGKRIVSASYDKTVKVWDAESFALVATLEGHSSYVNCAAYSPDGKRIVSASRDRTVKVWDAESFALVATLEGHSSRVSSAAYSPDGKRIVSASKDATVKVWDAESFECIDTIPNVPGLCVLGCDMRNLHPDSDLSDDDKELLRQYGAIVD